MKIPKLVLLVVVLPLLFIGTGLWQMHRANSGSGDISRRLAQVEESIQAVRAKQEQAKDPHVYLKVTATNRYTASMAFSDLRKAEEDLRWGRAMLRTIGTALCLMEMLCGLAGALAGIVGLVSIRGMGRRALASREALLDGFTSGRKLLPWLTGTMGFCVATAIACGIVFEVVSFASTGLRGSWDMKVVLAGLALAGVLLFGGVSLVRGVFKAAGAVFERGPTPLMGRAVSEAEAPKVWAFVREVAQKAGAAMPAGIVLGLDESFFVTERPVELAHGSPAPSGRILYLPLPYMAFMSKDEAAAVIGHELGHFTGADTEYSLRFSSIYASAANNLRAVAMAADSENAPLGWMAKPAYMLGEFFLQSFDLAVRHWSRLREFAADAVGASVTDARSVALSLLRTAVLAPRIDEVLSEFWNKGGKLEGGILAGVRAFVREEGLPDPADHLEDVQGHPTDTHPTVRARLEALKVEATPELMARARRLDCDGLLYELGIAEDPAGTEAGRPENSGTAA